MTLSPLTSFLVLIFGAVGTVGAGFPIARLMRKWLPDGLILCAAYAVGTGIVSLCGFVLCVAGKATLMNLCIVSAVGWGLFLLLIRELLSVFAGVIRSAFGSAAGLAGRVCAVGVIVFISIAALIALAPPIEVDALSYHLTLPKSYAVANGFISTPSIVYSHFPLSGEILYLLPMAAGAPICAALFHLLFGAFTALAIGSLGNRLSGDSNRIGPIAALLFIGTPLVVWEMRSSYVDLAMCFYIFISFSILILSVGQRNLIGVGTAGLCAGFAVAVKLTAGPSAVILLFLAIIMFPGKFRERALSGLIFSIFCVLPVLPWFVRTYIETGNPVFPFAYEWFGGSNWNAALNKEFLNWHFGYGAGRDIKALIELPYNLTYRAGGNFGWPVPKPDRELGYIFLFFLPLLFMPGAFLKKRLVIGVYVVMALALWFLGTQQLRFLLIFLPHICLLYAAGFMSLTAKSSLLSTVLTLLLTVFLGTNVLFQTENTKKATSAIFGGSSAREKYISDNVASYNAYKALDSLGRERRGGSVGLLLDTSSFYSNMRVVWLNPMQQGIIDYENVGGPDALLRKLRENDIRWLLVNKIVFVNLYKKIDAERMAGRPYSKYFFRFFSLFRSVLNSPAVAPVYDEGGFVVYELK